MEEGSFRPRKERRMPRTTTLAFITALAAAITLGGCSGGASRDTSGGMPPLAIAGPAATASPIQHVVIMIQENRSFDNLFATFPGADGATKGLMHTGKYVTLTKSPLPTQGIGHLHGNFVTGYDNGKMDGFDL